MTKPRNLLQLGQMITAKLLEIDRLSVSRRIYPRKVIEDALVDWERHFHTKTMPIFKGPTATPNVDDIVGYAENFRFEEGYLVADVGFIEGREKDVGAQGEIINIRPNGSGTTDENGVIEEGYRIVGLCVKHATIGSYEKK